MSAALSRSHLDDWRERPDWFARDLFDVRPWRRQKEVLISFAAAVRCARGLEKGPTRVSVRSGHKSGKLVHDDTLVPTPSGWKRHGDLRVGDQVFDERGEPCNVVATIPWNDRPLMRVTFEDGSFIDADEHHEWVVRSRAARQRMWKGTQKLETRQLSERMTVPNGRDAAGEPRSIINWTIDMSAGLDLPERSLPLDPYLLGLWLGDGTSAGGGFTNPDGLERAFERCGFVVTRGKRRTSDGRELSFYIQALIPILRSMGIIGNKHVPDAYLWASKEQRLALLQGLMDTDGTITPKGWAEFTNTRRCLSEAVLRLARSLGIKARMVEHRARLNGRDAGPIWNVSWCSPTKVFRLPRKAARLRTTWKQKANAHKRMAIVSIEPLPGRYSAQCIEVDSPSHLYLVGESMVPTHNSTTGALAALWSYVMLDGVRVIMTAPSGHQVEDVLWREIRRLYLGSAWPIGGKLYEVAHRGLVGRDGAEIKGIATKSAEMFSGISAPIVVYIVDEASGVDESIFEAIAGNSAGGAVVLLLGNPTSTSGTFYDSHHSQRASYRTHHISSTESPNIVQNEIVYPGLASPIWLEERQREWGGPGNAMYDVRVLGQFAKAGQNIVIPPSLVEKAISRMAHTPPMGRLHVGVDVARFGDDSSVLRPRRGNALLPEKVAPPGTDTVQLAYMAADEVNRLRLPDEREPALIKVDSIGVGAGTCDKLRELRSDPKYKGRFELMEINVGEKGSTMDAQEKYANLRAQMWFAMREWMDQGGALEPNNAFLEGELCAVRYGYDSRNRYTIEPKDETKKRLKRSPDRADALMLAVWGGTPWVPVGSRISGL